MKSPSPRSRRSGHLHARRRRGGSRPAIASHRQSATRGHAILPDPLQRLGQRTAMTGRLDLLDNTDRKLISLLQQSARESVANLARKLGVARTTVVARLARLEKNGVIVGYTVKLGQEVQDSGLLAYVGITVEAKTARDVLKRFKRIPEIEQLCSVSGEFDYVAWLRAGSAEQLDKLLDDIGEIDGVIKTTTSIVLSRKIDR